MKIWLKYLIGIIIGVGFSFLASSENVFFTEATAFISNITILAGRYSLYPVLFFGFTVSIFELRENRGLFRIAVLTILIAAGFALLLSAIGLVSVLVRQPARIPIFVEGVSQIQQIGIKESILQLLPASAFEAFVNGSYILPLCILGGFAGAGCVVDKAIAKPSLTLFDSLARVSYAVMVFFVDILAIGFIAVSAHWVIEFRVMLSSKIFIDFIILLFVNCIIIAGVIYPVIIKLICRDINPYRVIYAAMAPCFAAFISGDANMTLPVLLRHSNESLGVRRRISSVTLPMFSVFGRAGTAMVITVSFIVILKSYSSLGVGIRDMFWLIGVASLFSFCLGRFPSGGAFIALTAICMLYGGGFESGYLILRPAAFYLGSIACALDALTALTGTYIIGHLSQMTMDKDLRFFI
ncbi:dicarboxylate/amino acid:cation symporter [Treponema phagedenis]|uniref:dicarboxylate/amino acid:cation symporter n=1 Tax=Treponema phagedenis TaxID=162 RepID=UPI0011EE9702|nr:cation:dicarboxylase symporter family transporter [Treponema phagedenis]TYT77922.1 dicarboxylate/amino acid:cation symporter [Treponema phagedenis]